MGWAAAESEKMSMHSEDPTASIHGVNHKTFYQLFRAALTLL